jgi:glycosyltransferase involved in cell wall biosynthesis
MPAEPLVSIVVPCYNQGRFLAEAVRSAITSSVPVEVVVVNDGSTDCTEEVARMLESTPGVDIRYVDQPNSGVAGARNRGLRESRGRYVVFLDADDRLTPGGIEAGTSALTGHPEYAFVFGRSRIMTASGAILPTPARPRVARNHYRELLRRNYIGPAATVMFRREAVERAGGFNTGVNATADYELYLHIARHHPVFDHAQVVAHHRTHDTNMCGDVARMLRETLMVLRRQRPFLEGDDASLDAYEEGWRLWQEFYGTRIVDEIRGAVAGGAWACAGKKALTLARHHPRGLAQVAARTLWVGRRNLSLVK